MDPTEFILNGIEPDNFIEYNLQNLIVNKDEAMEFAIEYLQDVSMR